MYTNSKIKECPLYYDGGCSKRQPHIHAGTLIGYGTKGSNVPLSISLSLCLFVIFFFLL